MKVVSLAMVIFIIFSVDTFLFVSILILVFLLFILFFKHVMTTLYLSQGSIGNILSILNEVGVKPLYTPTMPKLCSWDHTECNIIVVTLECK